MNSSSPLVESIIKGIQEKKGRSISVCDLRSIETAPCQYFVIASGGSPQQVEALARSVADFARKDCGEKPAAVVGLDNAVWVAADFGTVMVHLFAPGLREYYDIEHLWADAAVESIPDFDAEDTAAL